MLLDEIDIISSITTTEGEHNDEHSPMLSYNYFRIMLSLGGMMVYIEYAFFHVLSHSNL
jgi:hypothetical protein